MLIELTLICALAQSPQRVCAGVDENDQRAFPAVLTRHLPSKAFDGEVRVVIENGSHWPYERIGGRWVALSPPFAVWPYRFPCAAPQPAPPALPPSHLIALVFSDTDVRRMRLDDAEKLYAQLELDKFLTIQLDDEDERMFAALTTALGTLPDARRLSAPLLGTRERLDWEVRRGVRRAAQSPDLAK